MRCTFEKDDRHWAREGGLGEKKKAGRKKTSAFQEKGLYMQRKRKGALETGNDCRSRAGKSRGGGGRIERGRRD